jgi:hypothetical protein
VSSYMCMRTHILGGYICVLIHVYEAIYVSSYMCMRTHILGGYMCPHTCV